ncbi:MAG: hypothetical protein KAH95_08645 [Spirochaetales bacterium]|nr:hypothetical protein [Spirochaetales bacterium]
MTDKILEASEFGLNSKTILVKIDSNHIGIIKNRKSRIIMKDGTKILEAVEQIKKISPDTKVSLITNAPVCSKTTKYLLENDIEIISETP